MAHAFYLLVTLTAHSTLRLSSEVLPNGHLCLGAGKPTGRAPRGPEQERAAWGLRLEGSREPCPTPRPPRGRAATPRGGHTVVHHRRPFSQLHMPWAEGWEWGRTPHCYLQVGEGLWARQPAVGGHPPGSARPPAPSTVGCVLSSPLSRTFPGPELFPTTSPLLW